MKKTAIWNNGVIFIGEILKYCLLATLSFDTTISMSAGGMEIEVIEKRGKERKRGKEEKKGKERKKEKGKKKRGKTKCGRRLLDSSSFS